MYCSDGAIQQCTPVLLLLLSWHASDGFVNTTSARAPFGAPQKPFERSDIQRDVWNVLPDRRAIAASFKAAS